MSDLFFGFDLSTQQLKLIVTGSDLSIFNTYSIEFDRDLKHYNTQKGVYSNSDGEINAPVLMWIEAVDLLFSRLKEESFPFDRVRGISGSCQQHGSVFFSESIDNTLASLNPDLRLIDQIKKNDFSYDLSPNWQDHSTGEELNVFSEYIGSDRLAQLTGSKAHYRFTGLQIRKIKKSKKDVYEKTHRISLVSSFLASLFIGKVTGIEESDACGMNLYDISKREWNNELLSIASISHEKDGVDSKERDPEISELKEKLGSVVEVGPQSIGSISQYFITKYGFNNTQIYSFTGDNLATILSLPLNKDDYLISLGTSTTVLLVTDKYIPSPNYHLFIHPTIPNSYMGMICYCNGSLAREKVRDQIPSDNWDKFNEILKSSSKFDNRLGIYFPLGEIVPNAPAQTIRGEFSENQITVTQFDNKEDIVSIVESQALSCRARGCPMLSIRETKINSEIKPVKFDGAIVEPIQLNQRPNKVIFVGGASKNTAIVSKFASILGSLKGNYRMDNSNACAIGGAYKAHWSFYNETKDDISFNEFLNEKFNWKELEPLDVNDEWESYIPGVTALSLLEEKLQS